MESSKNRLTITGILVSALLTAGIFTIMGEAVASHQPTVVVDDDGFATILDCNNATTAADSSTIQGAISLVGPHTIIICPGTYLENLSITGPEKLVGFSGPAGSIVDGSANPSPTIFVSGVCTFDGTFDVEIEGLEIKNGFGGVVVSTSCQVNIKNNNIHDNNQIVNANQKPGIQFLSTDHSWIWANIIHDQAKEGITLEDGSDNNFVGSNRIFSNGGDGISVFTPSTSNLITQNRLEGNADGIQTNASGNTFKRNNALNNGGFGYRDDTAGGGTAGTGNTYIKNKCSGNGAGGSVRGLVPPFIGGLCSPQI